MGRASIERPRHLAGKLAFIRKSMGLSQNEFIVKLDLVGQITQAEISAFELGKRLPPLKVLLLYAKAQGIYVDDLIDDEVALDGLS